jgi:hypothetical protein
MRTPLGNVDASWLRMDEPANLMVVTGVYIRDLELGQGARRTTGGATLSLIGKHEVGSGTVA